jgi:N-methylhydantoinase B
MRNTRLPQSAMGDLNGQLGALDLGVKRLDELLDEYGADTVPARWMPWATAPRR